MTYREGWEEILLFSLGVRKGTWRTWGFKNKLCVLESFVVRKALWHGGGREIFLEPASPGWCNHSQLRSGTGRVVMTFPFPLLLRFRVSVTTPKCLSLEKGALEALKQVVPEACYSYCFEQELSAQELRGTRLPRKAPGHPTALLRASRALRSSTAGDHSPGQALEKGKPILLCLLLFSLKLLLCC